MKKLYKYVLPLIFLMSSHAFAWESIAPNTYAIYGQQVLESNDEFEPTVELVYNSDYDNFGISFVGLNGERKTLPYGVFRMKSCRMDTTGAIAGHNFKDPASEDQLGKIFITCDRPAYLRIWNTTNNYSLYKFETGPLTEK